MNPKPANLDRIHTVTGLTFDDLVLAGTGPIVVEFMSYGCGFCRAVEPILQQVAENLHSNLQFFRVNVPAETDLAGAYEIAETPTFVMFLNGTEMGRADGPDPTLASITNIVTQPFNA